MEQHTKRLFKEYCLLEMDNYNYLFWKLYLQVNTAIFNLELKKHIINNLFILSIIFTQNKQVIFITIKFAFS